MKQHPIKFNELHCYVKLLLWRFNLQGRLHVDDIYAELVIRFHKAEKEGRIDNKPGSEHPQRWARTAVKHVIQELARRENKATSSDILDTVVADNRPLPMELITQQEVYAFLHEAIKTLGEQDAQLIELHYLNSMSWPDIAAYLLRTRGENVTASTLRKRGQRALNRLRKHLLGHDVRTSQQ